METKQSFKLFTLTILLFIAALTIRNHAWAASGSITAEPNSGSFVAGSLLNVDIKVDGGGVPFNAAKANVALVPNATIQSIQFGNCGFAFIETPTTSNPSFVGVILGGFSQSCTAYTMRFQAAIPGTQLVNISNASIKSYNGAQEELQSVRDGNFSIVQSAAGVTPIVGSPVVSPSTSSNGSKLYSVSYSIPVPKNTPLNTIKVMLDSGITPSQVKIADSSEAEDLLVATFENVPEGAHTLSVASGDKTLSEEVVYLDGENKNLSFGSTPQKTTLPILWFAVAGLLLIVVGVAGFFGFRWFKSRQGNSSINMDTPQPPTT